MTGQVIGPHDLPEPANEAIGEEVYLRDPIAGLIEIAASAKLAGEAGIHIGIPQSTVIVSMMNERNRSAGITGRRITDLYWQIHRTLFDTIADVVRTNVVELVADLRTNYQDSGVEEQRNSVNQAVNVHIYGKAKM